MEVAAETVAAAEMVGAEMVDAGLVEAVDIYEMIFVKDLWVGPGVVEVQY